MKHSLLRLSILALVLTINTIVFADTFVVNGIRYSTTSSSTVKVYSKSPKYSGNVVIPESVNYNETTYPIHGKYPFNLNNTKKRMHQNFDTSSILILYSTRYFL